MLLYAHTAQIGNITIDTAVAQHLTPSASGLLASSQHFLSCNNNKQNREKNNKRKINKPLRIGDILAYLVYR